MPVSAPRQHTAPTIVTTPIAANIAPEPVGPKPRTMTAVSTKPNRPLTAAPASPIIPLRALRRISALAPAALVVRRLMVGAVNRAVIAADGGASTAPAADPLTTGASTAGTPMTGAPMTHPFGASVVGVLVLGVLVAGAPAAHAAGVPAVGGPAVGAAGWPGGPAKPAGRVTVGTTGMLTADAAGPPAAGPYAAGPAGPPDGPAG